MNLKPNKIPEAPDVTLTPLIDVVFLLLIFFMVSTTFERSSELSIELPEATPEAELSEGRIIEVAIDAQGYYYINGKQLVNTQFETLKKALTKLNTPNSPPLILSADEGTPYQSVVTLMDVAQQLGFARLRFATRLVENPNK
uniref:Biopolymer transport protein ExbD n=1 Tax=Candidatus Kentrum sp. LFY TaxID=2126342 RepID=A0A450U7H0_9GAMM|nr:MAG: biopolymer transport protein ExbD [Candidatus Kentron sp. LFY]VFJ87727.1 MAG: biopolymer transport protein ExbD [Candidatus Kentron sp. LFY]VFK14492.1 MAG: biopolymer transport protein ExbD [Candidatus Kentron sp. LFY]